MLKAMTYEGGWTAVTHIQSFKRIVKYNTASLMIIKHVKSLHIAMYNCAPVLSHHGFKLALLRVPEIQIH